MSSNKKAKTAALIFMIVLGIIWIAPVSWLVLSSFKKDADFITSFANLQGSLDYLKLQCSVSLTRLVGLIT